MSEEKQCGACGRIGAPMIETALYYICEDAQECIAAFSGWNEPIIEEKTS